MNECKKMNGVWFLHFTNILLFYIDVCTMQSNILKHGFYSLFIYLFPFLLPSVGNFEIYVITCLLTTITFSPILTYIYIFSY